MRRFKQYEIKEREDGSEWELGRGAMGVSYLAWDPDLHREVALKVISEKCLEQGVVDQDAKDAVLKRFRREAQSAGQIIHENVASIYQFGIEGDSCFYAMEFVRGDTVAQRLEKEGPFAPAIAVDICIQVCRALAAADQKSLIHRDIKPANIMLTEHDGALRAKVIDFGLAKPSQGNYHGDATLTLSGFVGTPSFASPEQLQEQDLDIRSDLYSLGVTLWYMLDGRPPFTGSITSVFSQHVSKPLPVERLHALPPALQAILEKSLQKAPADRFQSPADFREALEACNLEACTQGEEETDLRGADSEGSTSVTVDAHDLRPQSSSTPPPQSGNEKSPLPAEPQGPSQARPMSIPPGPKFLRNGVVATAKTLYLANSIWRGAAETAIIGIALMAGISIFGPTSGNSATAAPMATYKPPAASQPPPQPPPASPAVQAPVAQAPAAPTVSAAQYQAIKAASGGGPILSALPVEARKMAPAVKLKDVQIPTTTEEDANFGKFSGKKKSNQPTQP